MAGFREFVTGEVLTAANVDDFLAKQVVQKYADAAARDAALGTAVAGGNALREGMVAWLDDTNSVIAYDGTAWNPVGAEPPAGIGSNVVSTFKNDTFTTTSLTFTTITGLEATITPTSATSKILVVALVQGAQQVGTNSAMVRLVRDATAISVGGAEGSRTQASGMLMVRDGNDQAADTIVFLDSPATTSATTYGVQIIARDSGTVHVNRSNTDANVAQAARTVSSITVIEVAA